MRRLFPCVLLAIASLRAGAQMPDSSRAIRFEIPLYGPVIVSRIATEMMKQNISLTSESVHLVTGSPIDAPDVEIRINVAESGPNNVLMISAVGAPTSTSQARYAIDRGTRGGKEWQRLEDLAAALRKSLVIK